MFSHVQMRPSFERYFAAPPDSAASPHVVLDLLLAYVEVLGASCVHQVGCFTAGEARHLVSSGYGGRVVASDFDQGRLDYLSSLFADTPFSRIELEQLDIESEDLSLIEDADIITADRVLSNIQPEALPGFFTAAWRSRVQVMLVGDIYDAHSLGNDVHPVFGRSFPSRCDTNWYHSYHHLAAAAGFAVLFIPEFNPARSSHRHGIFIVHRGLGESVHVAAVQRAFSAYVRRQGPCAWWTGSPAGLASGPCDSRR